MVKTTALLLIALGAGCDYAFRLDYIDPTIVGDANKIDAAPCATPSGHDEDSDGVDDACDSCPQHVTTQPDADRDGIGDACDPNPGTAGDALVRFFSFDATDNTSVWNRDPEWAFDTIAGDLTYNGGAVETRAHLLAPVPIPPYEVQVGVTLGSVDRALRTYFVVNGNAGAGIKLECSGDHMPPTNDLVTAFTHSIDGSGYEEVALPTDSYATNKKFQLTLTARTGTNPRMICEFDGGFPVSAVALINATPSATPAFQLIARGSMLRVHWLAIYSIPPDN